MTLSIPHLSRRGLIAGSAATFASASIPRWASAAPARDPRLVVVILRGALDGLSAVAPIGDPDYADLHRDLALRWDGEHPALKLTDFFGLNPAMTNFVRLYDAKQALIVHATATNYRERSHFDGQDMLESGQPAPGRTESGWLNRAVAALPKGERVGARGALAVGYTAPLVMRGPAPILGWAPSGLTPPTDDLVARLAISRHADPELRRRCRPDWTPTGWRTGRAWTPQTRRRRPLQMKKAATGAARLMNAEDGPRIGALAIDGWDTHANEGGATGRLAQLLGGLDGLFAAFESELGPRWKDTVVVAITEFGRTAHINGTIGTDHGTGTVAFLAGGAVAGGRVVADWPGLKSADLSRPAT